MGTVRIDLRTPKEIEACPAPASVVLSTPKPPLSPQQIAQMAEKLLAIAAKIPQGTPIELFCAKGRRAGLAAAILQQAGHNAINLGAAKCKGQALMGTVTLEQRKAIVTFIRKNRVENDDVFHAFAQSIGVDPDDAEPVVYQLAHDQARRSRVAVGVAVGAAALGLTGILVMARRSDRRFAISR